jgi:hypothetical protein
MNNREVHAAGLETVARGLEMLDERHGRAHAVRAGMTRSFFDTREPSLFSGVRAGSC